jgi:hypothetical protein
MTTAVGFEPVESLAAFHNRELEWLQTMTRGGSELAPAAALFYCHKNKISAPDWVIEAASVGYCKALNGTLTKKLGRSSGPVERYQQDMVDYARWEAISDVREKQRKFPEDVKELRSRPNIPKSIVEEKKENAEVGWQDLAWRISIRRHTCTRHARLRRCRRHEGKLLSGGEKFKIRKASLSSA